MPTLLSRLEQLESYPTVTQVNLLASAMETAIELTPDQVFTAVRRVAKLLSMVSVPAVMTAINEDRSVSGFPQIIDERIVFEELEGISAHCASISADLVRRCVGAGLPGFLTRLVSVSTGDGAVPALPMIDALVAQLAVDLQQMLTERAEAALSVTRTVLILAERRPQTQAQRVSMQQTLDLQCAELARRVQSWDEVAQPLQLAAMASGLEHAPSRELADELRRVYVSLVNDHGYPAPAKRIALIARECFAELRLVSDRTARDLEALEQLQSGETEGRLLCRVTSSDADEDLIITSRLVRGGDTAIDVDDVRSIAWSHSDWFCEEAMDEGAVLWLEITSETESIGMSFYSCQAYTEAIQALWDACGTRLLSELIRSLRDDEAVVCGSLVIYDSGVLMPTGEGGGDWIPWQDTDACDLGDGICITCLDSFASVTVSYDGIDNAHLIRLLIESRQADDRQCLSTFGDS